MKKLLVALALALGLQFAYAQKSVYMELPDRLFTQGKEMFMDNNYVGCIHSLQQFTEQTKDSKLRQEAEYMIVSSMFYRGKDHTGSLLKDYLEKYPETYHRNQLAFFIGTTHFDAKQWKQALHWFSQSDVDYLTVGEQEDYSYRFAYASLQEGSKSDARNLFGLLARNSKKYTEPASYYLAYIDFQEGRYQQAIPVFRKLKSSAEYKENATFFLMQATYLEGDMEGTIAEGKNYISSYPNTKNSTEVYRLLANSYYRLGNTSDAITNYERYLETATETFREDMYQLGEAYYQTGAYDKSLKVLKSVASMNDRLGQAAYMLLGQSYLKMDDTSNAILSFDAAARAQFDPVIKEEALYNYAMIMNKGGVSAFGQSITASQRFLTEFPNSKYTDQVNAVLATTLLSTKNYNMALDAIKGIKSPGKQILEAKQMILLQLGVQEFIDGDFDLAERDFNATIAMGNYNTEAKNESYFWRGETAYRKGDYKAAAKDYTAYIAQVSPSQKNYALALYGLGYANFQNKEYNAALANFKKYIAAEKDRQSANYSDALNRIGDSYLFNRNFAEAENYYSQAVTVNPSNADYSEFQKAFVLGLQKNYNGKISALNSMMAKYPDSRYYDDALYEKSRALVMLDKEAEAIAVLEQLLKEHPRSNLTQKAGVQLGQLYFNINNPQKSIEAYKAAISNQPNTEEARAAIQSLEGVYKDINDIGSYAHYVNSLGGTTVLSASRQDSLTYLAAENVYMKGRKNEAKTAMDKYLRSYPKGVFAGDAHFYLGSMAFDTKDFATALNHFNEVISLNNPKYRDDALIYASGIEFDNRNYQAAYTAYERLSTVASNTENRNVGELGMLRSAYLMKKDSEVITSASKLLENSRLSADVANEARFYRGKSLKNLGRNDDAITDLQYVAKDTRNVFGAESQYLLGDIYYKQRAYDKAEKQILGFMKEGTSHEYWMARAVIVLSDVYAAKGEKFQARQYLESLQANYRGSEQDVTDMISERLANLK